MGQCMGMGSGKPEGEWDWDLGDKVKAQVPGEYVTLSLSPFLSPSLPISNTVSSHSYGSLSGSPGLGTCGPRARGGGEHAQLVVTEPAAAADHAPMRVHRPAAGPSALPRLRKHLLGPPLLSARDELLRHQGTLHGTPPAAFGPNAADCKVRRAPPCSSRARSQTSFVGGVQTYPGSVHSIPRHC